MLLRTRSKQAARNIIQWLFATEKSIYLGHIPLLWGFALVVPRYHVAEKNHNQSIVVFMLDTLAWLYKNTHNDATLIATAR